MSCFGAFWRFAGLLCGRLLRNDLPGDEKRYSKDTMKALFAILWGRERNEVSFWCYWRSNRNMPPPPPTEQQQQLILEALERALAEVEALQAIYGTDFRLTSEHHDLQQARQAVQEGRFPIGSSSEGIRLDAILHLSFRQDDDANNVEMQLRLGFPAGYPSEQAAIVSIQNAGGCSWTRSECEHVTRQLQERAASLVGREAVMELVQELQDIIIVMVESAITNDNNNTREEPNDDANDSTTEQRQVKESAVEQEEITVAACCTHGRRWIWVHHITDVARRKSILEEARELNLGGFLKHGYPVICYAMQ